MSLLQRRRLLRDLLKVEGFSLERIQQELKLGDSEIFDAVANVKTCPSIERTYAKLTNLYQQVNCDPLA